MAGYQLVGLQRETRKCFRLRGTGSRHKTALCSVVTSHISSQSTCILEGSAHYILPQPSASSAPHVSTCASARSIPHCLLCPRAVSSSSLSLSGFPTSYFMAIFAQAIQNKRMPAKTATVPVLTILPLSINTKASAFSKNSVLWVQRILVLCRRTPRMHFRMR